MYYYCCCVEILLYGDVYDYLRVRRNKFGWAKGSYCEEDNVKGFVYG